ncbi:MAG: 16S rRNA (cytidine(1402)-2'-O)-methyltransferase [Bacillota bacterium]|nr:16S rRNA (cytidine(1402)-2'-O)-methyltransferase [Bacillota bacterium]
MGKLYVCGTPIGNLEDASIRLLKTLRKVDMIACEDTRHTLKLLNRFKIKNKLVSYHQFSSEQKEDYIIEAIREGKDVALVSDAGMPTISDPGENLVRRALEAGVEVEVVPGPSACTAALVISGLTSAAFVFEGFLPPKQKRRREMLTRIADEKRTVILYEAPHRILDMLEDMEEVFGQERSLVIGRELTKKYQEIQRGTVSELTSYFQINAPRGEFCILIPVREEEMKDIDMEQIAEEIKEMMKQGIEKKEAFKMKARQYNVKKSDIYNYFVSVSQNVEE